MSGQTATIDGRRVSPVDGETILAAARRLEIEIPALCLPDGASPEGGCRMCLVEADGRVCAACHSVLHPGADIRTATPRIKALRRDILGLTLSEHPKDAFGASREGSEIERLMQQLEVSRSAFDHEVAAVDRDTSHPYLCFDPSLCITCRRCLTACETVPGRFVYGIEGRGADTRIIFGVDDRFAESACVACGACVDACPTGAVSDRDRAGGAPAQTATRSVCGYCGVGCQVEIDTAGDRVVRIRGVEDAAVNRGQLCVKGRYAHAWHHSTERLTQPLRRENGTLRPVTWDEAIRWVAKRLREIRNLHGADALGVMTSSRSTNEAAYLFQKLFRTAFGTNNVDCCARVCHSSTALALQITTGTGAASASFDDIERARCIVVAGANPTEAHPVIGARLKQAALRGVPMVVIDPRRIELAEYATIHLQLRPGTNVALFNAMARILLEQGRIEREYVQARAEGLDSLEQLLESVSVAEAARTAGVREQQVARAARLIADHGPALFVTGLGLSETTQGTASVIALCNIAMLTGSIGRPGAGMLPLRGQNNVQGNADMGSMPNQVTGYQPLDDGRVRARLESIWGMAPPREAGRTIPEMIDGAARGQVRALWIQGEDIAQSDPNQDHVIKALQTLDLLVVQEMFMSETARFAHLVLPAAGALEQDGTFTNGERRIQRVRAAVPPPGESRPDWEVAVDLAEALGERWRYDGPADVMDEIARVAPLSFGGVAYDRLDGDGLQWPCPDREHGGTATVHADGFVRGKGLLVAVDYAASPEHGVDGYPYLLITGRILDHYNVGTMTRRTPSRDLVPADTLEIHPQDANRDAIEDGATVDVESRWGKITVGCRLSRRVMPGTLFLSFHFPETHTNRLVGPHVDPRSKCPDYKVTAVRLGRR